ncbi:hypothetical protein B0H17DRAFT_1133977 [Mycena rosella]|uniref:Uncharacterized protein n=1 Tax=Mycena rosella TaxID=1033263 RepID=A0AAD7DIC8_MYCRO|nr:hypothetical protein B0H17DRAFT_1133977 [Mycena rosella]
MQCPAFYVAFFFLTDMVTLLVFLSVGSAAQTVRGAATSAKLSRFTPQTRQASSSDSNCSNACAAMNNAANAAGNDSTFCMSQVISDTAACLDCMVAAGKLTQVAAQGMMDGRPRIRSPWRVAHGVFVTEIVGDCDSEGFTVNGMTISADGGSTESTTGGSSSSGGTDSSTGGVGSSDNGSSGISSAGSSTSSPSTGSSSGSTDNGTDPFATGSVPKPSRGVQQRSLSPMLFVFLSILVAVFRNL